MGVRGNEGTGHHRPRSRRERWGLRYLRKPGAGDGGRAGGQPPPDAPWPQTVARRPLHSCTTCSKTSRQWRTRPARANQLPETAAGGGAGWRVRAPLRSRCHLRTTGILPGVPSGQRKTPRRSEICPGRGPTLIPFPPTQSQACIGAIRLPLSLMERPCFVNCMNRPLKLTKGVTTKAL